ncbi:MAG TPA: signal transduction protein, partial [Thermoanaerobaculia bacterium]
MRFAGMDRNRDGRITRDEWRGSTNSFNRHDWNGDGVLSGIEVTPGAQRPGSGGREDEFDRLDRNDDGRISLSEWPGDRDRFARLDRNDDGFLSRDELRQGDPGTGDEFDRLDVNRDGRISLSEWPGDRDRFSRLDRNDDGFLSRDELR